MNLPALKSASDWCIKHSIIIPDDIVAGLYSFGIDVKTPGYYARVMWEAVRELYAGDIEAYDFEEVMLRLISEQLRKAWSEGMRELNLDPQTDQTEEGEAYLQEIMASELDYVGQLAEDILAAAEKQTGTEEFRARVDIWVGRYADTTNEAILFYSEKNQRLRWVYGDTQHCETCSQLNGIVAFASEWETAGVQPQSPPNDLLECQGWHCACILEPTDDRRSADALTRILDAVTAGNVGKSVKGGEGSGNFGHEGRPGEVGGSGPGGGGLVESRVGYSDRYTSMLKYPRDEYLSKVEESINGLPIDKGLEEKIGKVKIDVRDDMGSAYAGHFGNTVQVSAQLIEGKYPDSLAVSYQFAPTVLGGVIAHEIGHQLLSNLPISDAREWSSITENRDLFSWARSNKFPDVGDLGNPVREQELFAESFSRYTWDVTTLPSDVVSYFDVLGKKK